MSNDLILDNLSKPRVMKYMEILRILARKLKKDLDKATKEDLKEIITEIQHHPTYSPWTAGMHP
jgi:hypothetical protein